MLWLIFFALLAFMFGASWASFFCVVIERSKKHEDINGRSHCVCGRQLKWYENVPVFGWLRIGGVTKCCQSKLPVHYVVSEAVTGLIFAGVITALLGRSLGFF